MASSPHGREEKLKRSAKKQIFIESKNFESKQLAASDLPSLAQHYFAKHGIKIYINGETEYGRREITQQELVFRSKINDLKNDLIKYAAYLVEHLQPSKDVIFNMIFRGDLKEMNAALADFMMSDGHIKPGLTSDDLMRMNAICSRLSCKERMDREIAAYLSILDKECSDWCLSKWQCAIEIETIRRSLKESESVGYVFTNGHRASEGHTEGFILQADKIIKPIRWLSVHPRTGENVSLGVEDLKEIYETPMTSPIVVSKGSLPYTPQSGGIRMQHYQFFIFKKFIKR